MSVTLNFSACLKSFRSKRLRGWGAEKGDPGKRSSSDGFCETPLDGREDHPRWKGTSAKHGGVVGAQVGAGECPGAALWIRCQPRAVLEGWSMQGQEWALETWSCSVSALLGEKGGLL